MTVDDRDATRRFAIGGGAVRGELVRLDRTWRDLLVRRAYPAPLVSLIGECLAASVLFTAVLKMLEKDGRLSLQIQGGHPVSLLVAECRADLSVRAMARFDPDASWTGELTLGALAKGASFAVTLDPGGDFDSYQSLVPIEHDSVAEALNAYMRLSEQVESHFVLAANAETCGGLLVQKVSSLGGRPQGDIDPDIWNRIRTLTASLSSQELLELDDTTLLHRLFHQEEVRFWPERGVRFACPCSKERVAGVLRVLGRDEVRGLLADRRTIDVDCDFCGLRYLFSAEEAWAALAV